MLSYVKECVERKANIVCIYHRSVCRSPLSPSTDRPGGSRVMPSQPTMEPPAPMTIVLGIVIIIIVVVVVVVVGGVVVVVVEGKGRVRVGKGQREG